MGKTEDQEAFEMKKVLSTLLAVLMIVSVMSTGVTAFADKGGGTFTMEDAQARYDSVSSFDHVDIRVKLVQLVAHHVKRIDAYV